MRSFALPTRIRSSASMEASARRLGAGFTIPELLVVIGVIALLLALLAPALLGGLRVGQMAKSQARLKEIFTWMTSYSSENRDYIVPSQFDYTASATTYPVKVRSDADLPAAERHRGTWTDILWTYSGLGAKSTVIDQDQPANADKYMFDSPDRAAYESSPDLESPFWSSLPNTRDYADPASDGLPTPFGGGAREAGYPGYFAANNYFNATPDLPPNLQTSQPDAGPSGRWYVTGQIKAPDRSMYLVDSLAGETIEPDGDPDGPWDNPAALPNGLPSPFLEVDFRYNNTCLMLFLDGHSKAESPWRDLNDLETVRKIKVRKLDQN
jgi:prepilin-type N-terminal cleavage/methylation domain-containing protein